MRCDEMGWTWSCGARCCVRQRALDSTNGPAIYAEQAQNDTMQHNRSPGRASCLSALALPHPRYCTAQYNGRFCALLALGLLLSNDRKLDTLQLKRTSARSEPLRKRHLRNIVENWESKSKSEGYCTVLFWD